MAKKGQKQRKYTDELIEQVIRDNQELGKSEGFLAKKYGIPKGTITTWLYKFRQKGTTKREKQGRKPKSEEKNYKEKYEILKKYLEFLEEVEREKK